MSDRLRIKPDAPQARLEPLPRPAPVKVEQALPAQGNPDASLLRGARGLGLEIASRVDQPAPKAGRLSPAAAYGASALEIGLRARLPELAEMVRVKTGWPLDISGVKVEVVDSATFAKRVGAEVMRRAGVEAEDAANTKKRSLLQRLQRVLEDRYGAAAALGAYLPSDGTLLFNADAFKHANMDAVCEIGFHELVHCAQDQAFPDFNRGLDELVRAGVTAEARYGSDSAEVLDIADTLCARMAFLEGQATMLQYEAQQEHFKESQLQAPLMVRLLGQLSQRTASGRAKLQQYVAGCTAFQRIRGEPELIDLAFESPVLLDLMLKTRGSIVVHLPAVGEATKREATELAATFASHNTSFDKLSLRFDFG